MFFFSALTVAAACASLAAARIGPARNVDLPKDGCNSVGGLKWTDDTFDTVVRTWRDAFGGGGGSLNHGDGTTSTWQAVCCSQFCLDIRNDGGGTFSWSDADFERGVQKLKELKAGDGCTSANGWQQRRHMDGYGSVLRATITS
ncbi:hypothetical protein CPB85DRAFT_1493880 [Mucidula mucida]|nr:hypothetical protein CPB85DRAFT_1493880 [Mucidula mucida]